jgi:hypothetical protein
VNQRGVVFGAERCAFLQKAHHSSRMRVNAGFLEDLRGPPPQSRVGINANDDIFGYEIGRLNISVLCGGLANRPSSPHRSLIPVRPGLVGGRTCSATTMQTFQCADPADTTEMSDHAIITIHPIPIAKSPSFQRVWDANVRAARAERVLLPTLAFEFGPC